MDTTVELGSPNLLGIRSAEVTVPVPEHFELLSVARHQAVNNDSGESGSLRGIAGNMNEVELGWNFTAGSQGDEVIVEAELVFCLA
ncbi:MAG: hypothetical protein ACRD0W_25070 [Acidimicrobiales bacterium]